MALAVRPDGVLLVGERRTGRIRSVSPDGDVREEPVAEVTTEAATDDQRGLLGLAVAGDDAVFAAWTRAGDGRVVVAEVSGGRDRPVWEGPPSADLANGGHLAFLPDGRLLVGIGDLQDPDALDDPDAPNGKVLALDPDGPPDQRPEVLSSGWNNPFAFVVTAGGEVWVADNAPGERAERIGRGDGAGAPADLPGERAPSALVELAPGRLGLCGFLDGALTEVDLRDGRAAVGDEIADGCRTGAVALGDGRLALSDGPADVVRVIDTP